MLLVLKTLAQRQLMLFGRDPECDWVDERLIRYIECDPTLTDLEYAAIDAHVEACPACAEEHETVEQGWETLMEILHPDDGLPKYDVDALIQAAFAKGREIENRKRAMPLLSSARLQLLSALFNSREETFRTLEMNGKESVNG